MHAHTHTASPETLLQPPGVSQDLLTSPESPMQLHTMSRHLPCIFCLVSMWGRHLVVGLVLKSVLNAYFPVGVWIIPRTYWGADFTSGEAVAGKVSVLMTVPPQGPEWRGGVQPASAGHTHHFACVPKW